MGFFFLPLHIKSKVNKTLFTYKVQFKWFYWTKAALNVFFFISSSGNCMFLMKHKKGNSKIVYQQEETFEKDQRCTKRHVWKVEHHLLTYQSG